MFRAGVGGAVRCSKQVGGKVLCSGSERRHGRETGGEREMDVVRVVKREDWTGSWWAQKLDVEVHQLDGANDMDGRRSVLPTLTDHCGWWCSQQEHEDGPLMASGPHSSALCFPTSTSTGLDDRLFELRTIGTLGLPAPGPATSRFVCLAEPHL